MKRERKYKVDKLYIIKCGKYIHNKNVKPVVWTCTVRYGNQGNSIEEWHENHYQCDYDPSTEYLSIGYLSFGRLVDVVHGSKDVARGFANMAESYRDGDAGYDYINKNAGCLICRGRESLTSAFDIDKKKLTWEEIVEYYRILTGEKKQEEVSVTDIKDNILQLIIKTTMNIEQSDLIAEVKESLVGELRNLGEEYDQKLRSLRVSSDNFEASKQMLQREMIERITDIEYNGLNRKRGINDNDIVLFRRLMDRNGSSN